jgi:WD40 repeat protein
MKRIDKSFVLTLLTAFFALLTGVLGMLCATQKVKMAERTRTFSSIPLRNDHRRQTVRKMPREMRQPRFYDDTSLLYVSGDRLYRMSLREDGPEVAFVGHTDDVADYEVSPDGSRIVSSSSDGTLRLWDPLSGDCLAVSERLDTNDQPSWTMFHDVVYRPDGKRIMSADMLGARIWRASDLKLLSVEESDLFYLRNGLLSPDWKTVCVPELDSLDGFDIYRRGRKSYVELMHVPGEIPLGYAPDGRRVLSFKLGSGSMSIWDVRLRDADKYVSWTWLNTPAAEPSAAAFSPDGDLLVSAHADGTVRVLNARNGAEKEVLHWEGRTVDGICFDPQGARIVACSNGSGEYCLWGPFSWMI